MEKPKTPLSRKISDPVQLKPGNEEFIRRWNGLDLSDQSDASSDELPKHPNVWVEIAHILRPILGACGRQCREKNKWKHVKTPCRRKSRAVDQDQLWPLESCRRAKSEAWLCGSNSVKVDCIAEYSPTDRRKKSLFWWR
ncbi:hypothetical protein M3Y94_00790600 [Aphelenchoides besseyi]|nr:hypothetical protein M3Y94_00790600 [Aphelenchoides besseyi]